MNLRFSAVFAVLGCVVFSSCYPYNENQNKKQPTKPAEKTVTSADQQKIQAQRDEMKAKEEAQKKETPEEKPAESTETTGGTTTDTTKPPVEEKRTDYAFANKVPGKEGFVFSPYNNKIVDVRDIPSGTLVQDPTYTGAGKGYFRVP
ncbi:MAG: hypothetical protein V4689_14775 [Verrucomicrobiota bacterium]